MIIDLDTIQEVKDTMDDQNQEVSIVENIGTDKQPEEVLSPTRTMVVLSMTPTQTPLAKIDATSTPLWLEASLSTISKKRNV